MSDFNANTSPIRILVVDDDQDLLRLIERILSSYYEGAATISTCMDASAATKICFRDQIEIILTDLNMEDRNGFHLLKTVKEVNPLTQVIMITASDSSNAIHSAFAMGADDYFVKPLDMALIKNCLDYMNQRLRRWNRDIPNLHSRVPHAWARCVNEVG